MVRLPRPPSGALDRREFEEYLTHAPLSAAALAAARPDVAHALYPTDGVVAGAWSRLAGRPSVLSYMGIPEALLARGQAPAPPHPRPRGAPAATRWWPSAASPPTASAPRSGWRRG